MNDPDVEFVLEFLLKSSQAAPVSTRIRVLPGAAKLCGDEHEANALMAQAEALQQAESICSEFNFSFSQKIRTRKQE